MAVEEDSVRLADDLDRLHTIEHGPHFCPGHPIVDRPCGGAADTAYRQPVMDRHRVLLDGAGIGAFAIGFLGEGEAFHTGTLPSVIVVAS